jgi:hypothetical protein
MNEINEHIAAEIFERILNHRDVYASNHDLSDISENLAEMERAGMVNFYPCKMILENGKLFARELHITSIGEVAAKKFRKKAGHN